MAQAHLQVIGQIDQSLVTGLNNIANTLRAIDVHAASAAARIGALGPALAAARSGTYDFAHNFDNFVVMQSYQMNQLIDIMSRRYRMATQTAKAGTNDWAKNFDDWLDELDVKIHKFYEGLAKATYPFRQIARGFVQATGFATLLGFGGLVAAGLFAGLTAKGVIQTGIAFERFAQQIRTFTGDANKAAIEMEKISQFAKRTPFELDEVTAAFVSLAQVGIAPTAERLTVIGDYAAALAQPITRVADAVRAAVGGGQFDRLIELGVPKAAIKAIDPQAFTGEKVADRARALAAILKYMRDRTAGTMERTSETLLIRWSNLLDALTRGYHALFKAISPVLIALVDGGRQIIEILTAIIQRSPKFVEWAEKAKKGEITRGLTDAVTRVIAYVLVLADIWKNQVWPWILMAGSMLYKIATTIYTIVTNSFLWRFIVFTIKDAFARLTALLEGDFKKAFTPSTWWQWAFAIMFGVSALKEAYLVAKKLHAAYKAHVAALITVETLQKAITAIMTKQFWIDLWRTIVTAVRAFFDVSSLVTFIIMLAVVAGLVALIYGNWEKIKDTIKSINDEISKLFGVGGDAEEDKDGGFFSKLKKDIEEKIKELRGSIDEITKEVDKEIRETMRDLLPPAEETAENTRSLKEQMEQFLGLAGPALQRQVTAGELAYTYAQRMPGLYPSGNITIKIPPMGGGPIEDYIRNVVASAINDAIGGLLGSRRM